jgi:hypothetical protein
MARLLTYTITCTLALFSGRTAWTQPTLAPDVPELQEGAPVRSSCQASLFAAHRQRVVTGAKDGTRITLRQSEACATCVNGRRVTFSIETDGAAAPRPLVIEGPAQIDEIRVVNTRRALILGQEQASVSEVIVVDPRGPRVIDRFVGLRATLSPDGTRVAYEKLFPLHFTEGVSGQYLVYDVRDLPSALRHSTVAVPSDPATASLFEKVNVGQPVFPLGAQNLPADNYGLPESAQHSLRSRFFWSEDSSRFAFSDFTDRSQWIVVADLSRGRRNVVIKSQRLDTGVIVDRLCADYLGREADAFTVSGVEFLKDEAPSLLLHVDVACAEPKTLRVDFDSLLVPPAGRQERKVVR